MDLDLSKAYEASKAEANEKIDFSLLEIINQARNEHGMRQQDFHRYHEYCSTKVHRLRQTMNKTHTSTTKRSDNNKKGNKKGVSKKAKRKAQSAAVQSENNKGKGNVFVRKSINVTEIHDNRAAQLFLFEAERAWSYSQELKQTAFENEDDGKVRKHGLTRVRRAIQWSNQLLQLLSGLGENRVDIQSRSEAQSYHVLLQAYEAFDKEKHLESMEFLSVARKLLYLVAEAQSDSRREALAHSYVDSTEPMLRFSAYKLELSEQDMDKLANTVASKEVCERIVQNYAQLEKELQEQIKKNAGRNTKTRSDEVQWRGKRIPIRNADLMELVDKVTAAEKRLRASLNVKENAEPQQSRTKGEHKRQRLTSAQRSAKKRGFLTAGTEQSSDDDAGPSKVTSVNLSAGSKTEMDGYDNLLASLTEAEDLARTLVHDNAQALSKSHSGRYEETGNNLKNAHEFLLYKLMTTRAERNMALMEEVHVKSEKRQARVRENVAERLKAQSLPNKAGQKKMKEPVRRRNKQDTKRKVRPVNQPRHAATRKSKASKAGRNGQTSNSKKSPRPRAATERLRQRSELKAKRIAARIVPGLTRLLDVNDMSCASISGLSLVESDSNLATLIEAKSAWYKAELLRLLAYSFSSSNEFEKGLVLLNRSELFIREARNAMELVDYKQIRSEDEQMPPKMVDTTFDNSVQQIAKARNTDRFELYTRKLGLKPIIVLKRISDSQSKAAQALRDMAAKFVDFDPVDLQQAAIIPHDVEEKFDSELANSSSGLTASRRPSGAAPVKAVSALEPVPIAQPTKVKSEVHVAPPKVESVSSIAEQEVVDEHADELLSEEIEVPEGPYDPANTLAEEEEEELAAQSATKRGWLGGWLGRK